MRFKTGLLVVCVLAGALTSVGASSGSVKPQTISLLEIDTSFAPTGGYSFTSHSPPGPGQGFAFAGTVYKWAGAKRGARFGHLAAICTVAAAPQALCNGVIFLPRGNLELLTPTNINSNSGPSDIAIVGGTGAYVGAQGYMHSTPIGGSNSNKSRVVIHLS
jgi:hypothetical protein